MSLVATFSLPWRALLPGRVLADHLADGDVRVELEGTAVDGDDPLPLVWVSGADPDAVAATLAAHDAVERADRVHAVGDETLFSVRWDGTDGTLAALRSSEAVLLEGTATAEGWTLQARFRDEAALESFYRAALDRSDGVELEDVLDQGSATGDDYGLTPEQRRTLVAAARRGFFRVPRETTMVDLADELGVSDSAVSQRIRRGLGSLVAETLADGEE